MKKIMTLALGLSMLTGVSMFAKQASTDKPADATAQKSTKKHKKSKKGAATTGATTPSTDTKAK